MLLDTGATKTIIRPDLVPKRAVTKPTKWQLRTATGDPSKINRKFKADIEEEVVIIGMDIMTSKR